MNHLEVDSVNLSFSKRSILSDIYLSCKTGDIVGLIGRNGTGKSSLMKIIFGSMHGQNQCVRLNGAFSHQLFQQEGAINYLPQDEFLMNYLTLARLTKIFKLPPQINKLEELSGIDHVRLGELSSGQKRLIEIVSVLFAPTKFSLLDEPFSFLSPKLVEVLVPLIRECAKTKGIILSDHQYNSVFRSCTHFHVLSNQSIHQIHSQEDLESFGYLPSKEAAAAGTE